jgi:aminopeptidase N
MTLRVARGFAAVLVVPALLAGCTDDASTPDATQPGSPTSEASQSTASIAVPAPSGDAHPDDPAYAEAVSDTVEDSVYPAVGDPVVDALHYDLDLGWTPQTRTHDAAEVLTFRATDDAPRFQLDLGAALDVRSARLDGERVEVTERGKDLVVQAPVEADQRYALELRYGGTPRPVAAPTTRGDFSTLGWTITDDGQVWTMQEPFGAYSWYAVNDQPSDKALYDFTVRAPAPWVGVANGELVSQETAGGTTTSTWHLDSPASSYLTTVAIGDFAMSKDRSESGVPMTYWWPSDDRSVLRRLKLAADEVDWIEDKLGPYPFSSLGFVVVDSRSGMETQTMITMGNERYALSPEVLVHEMVHQWYGDQVTPADWKDLWLSEGMAQYLQILWQADHYSYPVENQLRDLAKGDDQRMRNQSGPPADYDPSTFAEGNVYYPPALMWDVIRRDLGDRLFWRLAAEWPAAHARGNATYDEAVDWWSRESGANLEPTFDAWLLGATTPPYP